jgi:parallel beta-helix repeat protein
MSYPERYYINQSPAALRTAIALDLNGLWGADVRHYGAVLDGVTDDTAALQAWANVGGNLVFPVAATALISAPIAFPSNTRVTGCRGATIATATHDISMFTLTNVRDTTIQGFHFKQTSQGTGAHVGAVYLAGCTNCDILENEAEGMQWGGIIVTGSNYCRVSRNYLHDGTGGQLNSSADISVESTVSTGCVGNVVDRNTCIGGQEFGVACWDPYSGNLPVKNLITGNFISGATGYGILVYMPDAGDTYNRVIGNHVENITGSIVSNPSSGAGIYGVGAGLGGLVVSGNTIRNCCINTANATIAPAGIGLLGTSAGTVPIEISGNVISDMSQYWGILATGIAGGATIANNTIRQPASNTTGDCIRVVNSNNVTVSANTCLQLNTTSAQRGILVFAQAASCSNIAIVGNTVTGGHFSQIEAQQTSGNVVSGLTITGNMCNGGDNSCIPLLLNSGAAGDVQVTGNNFNGGNAAVVSQTACTVVRYANNRLKGTGTVIFTSSGANTASYYDKTNVGTGNGAGMVNGGTSLTVEQQGNAAPAAGTWAVGDRIEQSVPVVGSPKGWRCTVAGTPGTWVSEGNL